MRVMEVWSPSGNCMTMPRARPRGMMVALWMGSEPSVFNATNAWPASWNAVTCGERQDVEHECYNGGRRCRRQGMWGREGRQCRVG